MEPNTNSTTDELYNTGVERFFYKCYPEAIDSFTNVIELDPDDADAFFSRGLAYLMLERRDEALVDFLKAIDLGENIPQMYLEKCNYVNTGRIWSMQNTFIRGNLYL